MRALSLVAAVPEAMFPPNPAKIPEYFADFMKLGLDFGQALVTVIITFITNMTTILVRG